MGLIAWIIVGAIIGGAANWIMSGGFGLIASVVIGIVAAVIAGICRQCRHGSVGRVLAELSSA